MHTSETEYCLATGKVYCNYCPAYCCYRLKGSTLFLDAIDINRIARHLGISDGEVRKLYIEGKNTFRVRMDGSCIFLSNSKLRARCTIHPARPRQCRDFPYHDPCPYLEREDLLDKIQPKIECFISNRAIVAGNMLDPDTECGNTSTLKQPVSELSMSWNNQA